MPIKSDTLRSPALLIILDGFGLNPSVKNNAVVEADTFFPGFEEDEWEEVEALNFPAGERNEFGFVLKLCFFMMAFIFASVFWDTPPLS